MPFELENLVIDRVDLVDEGANSASFIQLYKRREQTQMDFEAILKEMTPEHAATIQAAVDKAKADLEAKDILLKAATDTQVATQATVTDLTDQLAKAKSKMPCTCDGAADDTGKCSTCGGIKKATPFDEVQTLKAMPQEARDMFNKMKAQKEAAEAAIVKAKEVEEEAIAKSTVAGLKALPVDAEKLLTIVKGGSPELLDMLSTINKAIEATVLDEVGKSTKNVSADVWAQIEAKAADVAKAQSISKAKAIGVVIQAEPGLYKQYLQGGAN